MSEYVPMFHHAVDRVIARQVCRQETLQNYRHLEAGFCPIGQIPFEALLALLDSNRGEAVTHVQAVGSRLECADSVRLELINPTTCPYVLAEPGWSLIRHLALVDHCDDFLIDLVRQHELEHLTGLWLGGLVNEAGMRAIVESPFLTRIQSFGCVFATPAAIDVLARSTFMRQLQILHAPLLTGDLLSKMNLAQLHELRVDLDVEGALRLATKTADHLRCLRVNCHDPSVVRLLADAKRVVSNIEHLAFYGKVKPDIRYVAFANVFPRLVQFQLTDNDLGPEDVSTIASVRLSQLDLSGNPLGDDGVRELFARPRDQLRELDLSHTYISDAVFSSPFISVGMPALRVLRLSENGLSTAAVKALIKGIGDGLQVLDLFGNPLGAEGAGEIASAESCRNLCTLRLSGIEADGAIALSNKAQWARLEELVLDFEDSHGSGLASMLDSPISSRLISLSLSRCLSDSAARILSAGLNLGELRRLHLHWNPLSPDGLRGLLRSTALSGLWDFALTAAPSWSLEGESAKSFGETPLFRPVQCHISDVHMTAATADAIAQSGFLEQCRWLTCNEGLAIGLSAHPNVPRLLKLRLSSALQLP